MVSVDGELRDGIAGRLERRQLHARASGERYLHDGAIVPVATGHDVAWDGTDGPVHVGVIHGDAPGTRSADPTQHDRLTTGDWLLHGT
ncbi:MAG: hypothetical protein JWO36_2726 [Myxococcales bacterium]|nr:hypothetical protein [Myxococcales bacterium]